MDKQELYKEVEDLDLFVIGIRKYVALNEVMYLIKQLDEPQKVTIPQFVASWIKYCKATGVCLYHALEMGDLYLGNYAYQKDYQKLKDYFESENNQETFAKAWVNGYEVTEEKRYIVRVKNVYKNSNCLNFYEGEGRWVFVDDIEAGSHRTKHTKEELEKGGFGEVFDSPLFVVEEVEE